MTDGVPRRCFAATLAVGMLLNFINQGDAVMDGRPVDYAKMALMYLVPYLVATYGAVAARRAAERRSQPPGA